jgi:hypothetical protein
MALALSKPRMSELYLSAGSTLFDVQIQTRQRKRQCNGLGVLVRVLCRERIDDVLMNECGI